MVADNTNKMKLGIVFPEYLEAYELWCSKPEGWDKF
jgi:hypothetical protein